MKAPRVLNPKPFVLKILVFKFFENKILRDTVLQNPRQARLSGISREKIDLDICPESQSIHKSRVPSKIYFAQAIHSLEAADASTHRTPPMPLRRLLISMSKPEHQILPPVRTSDLQSDRQPALSKAARN